MIFVLWLLLSVAIGYWAKNKQRSDIRWFSTAMLLSI